jgi:hypothetical protein
MPYRVNCVSSERTYRESKSWTSERSTDRSLEAVGDDEMGAAAAVGSRPSYEGTGVKSRPIL